ncbi:MAG: chromate transporter [Evtepia sp.]
MLPFFQRELVLKKKWLTDEQLLDLTAVAQCTPGVIAVNTATFCGYRVYGFRGAVFATLGVLFPPILIVLVISAFFWSFAENPWVQYALTGVRACVCALIINSAIKLGKKAILDVPAFLVFLVVFLLAAFVGLSPAILVICAGCFGLAYQKIRKEHPQRSSCSFVSTGSFCSSACFPWAAAWPPSRSSLTSPSAPPGSPRRI